MPVSDGLRAYIKGEAFILTDDASIDDAQASGRWIKTADPVTVRQ